MSLYITDPFSPHAMSRRDGLQLCRKCPPTAPTCPACPSGTACTMISQSCTECASMKCVQTSSSSSSSQDDSGGGSNAGAIAGGVVGGIAAIAIITFLIWWFAIRKKRNQQRAESEKANSFADARQARKSTPSIASTVLTRASNVIQIAYIPGVTNRSPPETPGELVPPVPPLPGASPDQHFFMPGDLRDSSWSDMSQARRSVAPSLRSSVATTIYRNNAIVSPMPAQQIMRTRAAVVSIHNGAIPSSSQNSLALDTPAVPAITQSQLAKAGVTDANTKSSIVARTVTAKPVMVKGSGKKSNTIPPTIQPIEEQSESISDISSPKQHSESPASGFDASSSDEEDQGPKSSANRTSAANTDTRTPTIIEDSPTIQQSPFNDHTTTPTTTGPAERTSALLETQDRTRSNRNSGAPPPRVESPFSDVNEVK